MAAAAAVPLAVAAALALFRDDITQATDVLVLVAVVVVFSSTVSVPRPSSRPCSAGVRFDYILTSRTTPSPSRN